MQSTFTTFLAPVKSLDTCTSAQKRARLSQRLASELTINAVNVEGSLFRSPWPRPLVALTCTATLIQGSPATPPCICPSDGPTTGPTRASRRQTAASKCADVRERCEDKAAVCRVLNTFSLTDVVLAGARRQPRFTPTTLSLASSWTPTSGAHYRPGRSTWRPEEGH